MGLNKKPTRYYSKKQERRVAKKVGGRMTSNSGATLFDKGDVVEDNFLLECKTTTRKTAQRTIKKDWLDKNKEEMFATGKDFNGLVFDFGDGKDFIILDFKTFQELYSAWKEMTEED